MVVTMRVQQGQPQTAEATRELLSHILKGEDAGERAKAIVANANSPPRDMIDASATVVALWRGKNRGVALDGPDVPKAIPQLLGVLHRQIGGDDPELSAYASDAVCDAAVYCKDYGLVADLMHESYPPLARIDAAATTLKVIEDYYIAEGRPMSTPFAPKEYTTAQNTLNTLRNDSDPRIRLHVAQAIETRMESPLLLGNETWVYGPEHDDYREACMRGLLRIAAGIGEVDDPLKRGLTVNALTNLATNQVIEQEYPAQARATLAPLLEMTEPMTLPNTVGEWPVRDHVVRELVNQFMTYQPYMSDTRQGGYVGTDTLLNDSHRILGEAVDQNLEVARTVLRYFRSAGYSAISDTRIVELLETRPGNQLMALIARAGSHPELREASVEAFRRMLGVGNETPDIAASFGDAANAYGEQKFGGLGFMHVKQAEVIAEYLAQVATREEVTAITAKLESRGFGTQNPIADAVKKKLAEMPAGPRVDRRAGEGGIDLSRLDI